MELRYFIIGVVIIGLLLILFMPAEQLSESEYFDCGLNKTCFKEYSGNCEKATYSVNENGTLSTMRVEGLNEEGECGLFTEITRDQKSESMTCWFPYNVTDFEGLNLTEACSGPLADTFTGLGQQIREEMEQLEETNWGCIEGEVWDVNFSKFVVNGIVNSSDSVFYCYTTFTFRIPGVFDGFNVQHYFNRTDEEIYGDYEHQDYGDLEEWCSVDETKMYSEIAVVRSKPFEFKNVNGTDWCYISFYHHMYEMPEVETHLFISNNKTLVAIKTSKGTVVEYKLE